MGPRGGDGARSPGQDRPGEPPGGGTQLRGLGSQREIAGEPGRFAWRVRIFLATGLSYTCYYFCRKPFYVAKAALGDQMHLDAQWLGVVGTGYLAAYALGQFVSGWAGSRWGPRLLVLTGMTASAACNLACGATSLWQVLGLMLILNGLAQSTGWPGNVGTMAQWFHRGERGTIMGFWCTNFQLGAGLATFVCSWALGRWGYPAAFWSGAAVLVGATLVFAAWQRNRPEDVGLAPILDPQEESAEHDSDPEEGGWTRGAMINVALLGSFYFFAKFIRYALWSWAPYLLHQSFQLSDENAGYYSTLFDWAGLVGVILCGLLSDKVFRGRRALISFLSTALVAVSCLLMALWGQHSLGGFGVSLALIGFFLLGPDALVSGAAAIEAGPRRQAAAAAGIINGMGSVGAVVQEVALGSTLKQAGVAGFVSLLVISSALAMVSLGLVLWRNQTGRSDL